jgi:hypothetical protein
MTPTVGSQGLGLVSQHCQNAKHLEPNATAERLNKIMSADLQIFAEGRGASAREQVSNGPESGAWTIHVGFQLGECSSRGCCRSDQSLSSPRTIEVWVYKVYQGRILSGCPGKVWVTKGAAKPSEITSEVVPTVISEDCS